MNLKFALSHCTSKQFWFLKFIFVIVFFCETIYDVNSNHMMFGVLGCKANSMIGRKNFAKEKDAQKEK